MYEVTTVGHPMCRIRPKGPLYVAERDLLAIAKFFVYCDLKRQIPIVVSAYDETVSSSSSFCLNQTTWCMQHTHTKKTQIIQTEKR